MYNTTNLKVDNDNSRVFNAAKHDIFTTETRLRVILLYYLSLVFFNSFYTLSGQFCGFKPKSFNFIYLPVKKKIFLALFTRFFIFYY